MTTVPGGRLGRVTVMSESLVLGGDVVVVRFDGEIDVGNVALVAEDVRRAVADATSAVLDLTHLNYAGSAALRMLEAEGTAMVRRGVRCLLVVPAVGSTRRLLGIVGLDGVFPVVTSLDEIPEALAG
jgi:anti-anti-sigma factor